MKKIWMTPFELILAPKMFGSTETLSYLMHATAMSAPKIRKREKGQH